MRGDVFIPARRSAGRRPTASVAHRRGPTAGSAPLRRGSILAGASLTVAVLALAPAPASATWAPGAFPASSLGALLADDVSAAPLLSGDGRFVVFQTSASVLLGDPPNPDERYAAGIVRKDLVTGEVAAVAPPQRVLRSTGERVGTGTSLAPQGISRDGRFVLFGTSARLSDDDSSATSPDVYVRDMGGSATDRTSYEIVSARDGSALGAEYQDPAVGSLPGAAGYALSADGRKAVFVTRGVSDLPAAIGPTTPAQQVWVRDLDARTTRLISRDRTDPSAAGTPAPQPGPEAGSGSTPPTVAISADGTKAVWAVGNAERQTPTAPREAPLGIQPALLWRDLNAIQAPSRRVAGAVDLDDPGCVPATYAPSDTATGPCYGPFVASEGQDGTVAGGTSNSTSSLQLAGISADGGRVLFASSAFRRPLDRLANRPSTYFLADMRPGVPRKSGVTVAMSAPTVASREPIVNARLAADGQHATFLSRDTRFDGLKPVGAFPGGNVPTFNAFAVDLDARSVERITTASDGGDYSTGFPATSTTAVAVPSSDGTVVTFAAPDGNLFVGDANGVNDVVVARVATLGADRGSRILPPAADPVPAIPPADLVAPQPLPSRYAVALGRVAVSRTTGTATVKVSLPAAGVLSATARGTAKRTVGGKGRRRTTTTTTTVGTATRTAGRASTVTITVKVGAKARTALRRSPYRLAVQLDLTFRPRGAAPTSATRTYTLKRSYLPKPARKRSR